ncbi:MAG: hypothetical protein J4G05_08280 [Chlorobi bacterium]|nr:hypothetical protein [Chlorobiota bacterium]
MKRSAMHSVLRASIFLLVFPVLLIQTESVHAQVVIRPSLGLQSMAFIGEPPAALPISPGSERELPLGGGIMGAHAGFRLQFEAFFPKNDLLRLPISIEYFMLNGKTTFALSSFQAPRKQLLTFTHEANIATTNIGLTASFFELPSFYVTAELKGVYMFETELRSRIFYSDNHETTASYSSHPAHGTFRIGGFAKIGSQVEFFEPFLLDFNAGVGTLNLLLKETDPNKRRDILVVDPTRHDPEQTVQYFSLGMTLVWKL